MRERDPTGNGKPIIVFTGRSNVGKSSTIRVLTGKKVRIGKQPGSTQWEQMIDFGSVKIVDIPGFGFMAGKSKTVIEETKNHIVQTLEKWSDSILVAVHIIDLSLFKEIHDRWTARGEIPVDVEYYSFLCEIAPRVIVVANKVDKVKKHLVDDELDFLTLRLREAVVEREPTIILTSTSKKWGVVDLRDLINEILEEEGLERPVWALT
jgi:GTP-binding protein EngB required for normal cell division